MGHGRLQVRGDAIAVFIGHAEGVLGSGIAVGRSPPEPGDGLAGIGRHAFAALVGHTQGELGLREVLFGRRPPPARRFCHVGCHAGTQAIEMA